MCLPLFAPFRVILRSETGGDVLLHGEVLKHVVLPWNGEQSICHGFGRGLVKQGYSPHSV
jgi:hypothetical protein